MSIELVTVNGMLVGRTFSDRWNLDQLGLTHLVNDRNGSALNRLRRAEPDFTFKTIRKATMADVTAVERRAFAQPIRLAA